MKRRILIIVNELFFAPLEEISTVLRQYFGGLKKKTLDSNLRELEEEVAIFRLLPEENEESVVGFIPGANSEVEEDLDLRRLIVENGLEKRDPSVVDWDAFTQRICQQFVGELSNLREDVASLYEDPKRLEMKYFDLSIRYHQLYGYFLKNHKVDFLAPIQSELKDLRYQLNKLEY
jgi:hypothetical protein